jgi:2'-5' RNA ligase
MSRSYYLAIEPPPVDRARLSLVMRRLGNTSPLPHITVVEPPRLSPELRWWDSIVDVSAHQGPITVALEGVQNFDDRVLYVAVYAPALVDLRRQLLEVTGPTTNEPATAGDDSTFIPHLTLVMARRGRSLPEREAVGPLLAHLETFRAFELTLYRRDIPAHAYRAWRRLPLCAS